MATIAGKPKEPEFRILAVQLMYGLGVDRVARLSGATQAREVRNWIDPDNAQVPDWEAVERVRVGFAAFRRLETACGADEAKSWFDQPNHILGHLNPIEALRESKFEEIESAVKARL